MKFRSTLYRSLPLTLTILALRLGALAPVVADDFATQLGVGVKAVAAFEYGQDPKSLAAFEQEVLRSASDSQKRMLAETRLLEALDVSSLAGKEFICRLLRTIAGERSIPKLETYLVDPELSHLARYVLGRMDSSKASVALHRALGRTQGELHAGLLNTLGRRRYEGAVRDAIRALKSSDPRVADAAAVALGGIASPKAVNVLLKARSASALTLRRTIDDALLACAEQFAADGQNAEAVAIYEVFYQSDRPLHHRIAALRGIVSARGPDATDAVIAAIKGDDAELRGSAIALSRDLEGKHASRLLATLLPTLSSDGQALLVGSLGARDDAPSAFAVLGATESSHERVRAAAYTVLGRIADGAVVDLLVQAAATGGELERAAARASLVELRGPNVDGGLLRALATASSAVKLERVRALKLRRSRDAVGPFLQLAWDSDPDVRAAVIEALGSLAREPELPALVALIMSPRSADDRDVIERAIRRVFREIPNTEHQAAPLLAALPGASGVAESTVIRLLGATGTDRAAETVLSAVDDDDPSVRAAAVETLASWPTAAPVGKLLKIAELLRESELKETALKGYMRMARSGEEYERAMALTKVPGHTVLVVDAFATVSSPHTLALAESFLDADEAPVRAVAQRAVVKIARGMRESDAVRVKGVMERIVTAADNDEIRLEAQEVLNHFEQYEGYILKWLVSGPYREFGKDARQIYAKAFLPEQPNAQNVPWKPLRRGVGAWAINLEEGVAVLNRVAAYVKTYVHSPVEQSARLELGSDDAIKAWVNGEVVHSGYTKRGLLPRDDIVPIKLKKGWNLIFLKVVDNGGGWMFCCRVRRLNGTALDGIKVSPSIPSGDA